MTGEVIHLKFKSPHVTEEGVCFHSCSNCRNKTFTLTEDKPQEFPMLRCAACGQHMGRMGWAHDD